MGYGNLKKWKLINPNINEYYWCSVCGNWNSPFDYSGDEFERQKSKNLCKSCQEKLKKIELFDKRYEKDKD